MGLPTRQTLSSSRKIASMAPVSHTRRMPTNPKKWHERCQVVKAPTGHMKTDGMLDQNCLKGLLGEAVHAVLSSAGHNLRMILAHLRVTCCTLIGHLIRASVLVTPAPRGSATSPAR